MGKNPVAQGLKDMIDGLLGSVRESGGFSPNELRQNFAQNETKLRASVLTALADGPKTGHEIIRVIGETSPSGKKPATSAIYPLLEAFSDEGLVKVQVKKDRKIYELSSEGQMAFESLPELEGDEEAGLGWPTPKWVDLKGEVPIAASRLAKVAIEVSQFGSKEQQQAAAAAIDEARKKIHAVLAEK